MGRFRLISTVARLGVETLAIGSNSRFCAVCRARGHGSLQGKRHIARIELRSIVETDAHAQMERVCAAIRRNVPSLREGRLHRTILIDARQTFKDVGVDHFVDRRSSAGCGVEMGWLKRYADNKLVFGMKFGRPQAEAGQQANNKAGCAHLDTSRRSHRRPFFREGKITSSRTRGNPCSSTASESCPVNVCDQVTRTYAVHSNLSPPNLRELHSHYHALR